MAVVGVVILVILWCSRSMSLTAMSLDTFIGVMATMIGLLVTFAIGWQVINALDIKSKLAEIEKLKDEINEQRTEINKQQQSMDKIAARIAYDAAVNRSYTLHKIGEHIKAFASTLDAIHNCLQIDEYEDLDTLLTNLYAFASCSHNIRCYQSDCEEICRIDAEIRKSLKYPLIKDRYDAAIKEYNQWGHIPIKDKKDSNDAK